MTKKFHFSMPPRVFIDKLYGFIFLSSVLLFLPAVDTTYCAEKCRNA